MTALPAVETCRLTRDGIPLVLHLYRPATVRAWALLLHGFGEHGGRYARMAEVLAEAGIASAIPDHRGHGNSGGLRGHIDRFEQYQDDLDAWSVLLRERVGLNAFTLIGHSFGGLLALSWALRKPLGVIQVVALSPQLGLRLAIPWYKRLAAAALLPVAPRLALPNGIDAGSLTHDPRVAEAYRGDPLVHDRVTLRAFDAMQRGMRATLRQAGQFVLPLLMCLGEEDPIIDVQVCHRWFEAVRSTRKVLQRYPATYHELHHEAVAPALYALVGDTVLGRA